MKKLHLQVQLFLGLSLLVSIMVFSCKKEVSALTEQEEEWANVISTQSDAEAEIIFNGVFDDVFGVNDSVGMFGTGLFGRVNTTTTTNDVSRIYPAPPCLDIHTVHLSNTTPFPVKVIYDFGPGCLCGDGHVRKGRIITTYTKRLTEPGATATTEFDNFFIDSIRVEGVHKISNTTLTTSMNIRRFAIDVIDAKLSKPNGNYSYWNSHKGIVQFDGFTSVNLPGDDAFKIGGGATGKVKRDNLIVAWRSEITDSLFKRFNCRWISKGRVRTIRETLPATSPWIGILDYGFPNGLCDNQAQLRINTRPPYNITLR
jgi:hypothetical protein